MSAAGAGGGGGGVWLQVLKRVAERGELASVALNTHGTRAVQKLIETLSSREQKQVVIEALRGGEAVLRGRCWWGTGRGHAVRAGGRVPPLPPRFPPAFHMAARDCALRACCVCSGRGEPDQGPQRQPRGAAVPAAAGPRGLAVHLRRGLAALRGHCHAPARLLRAAALHRLCHAGAKGGAGGAHRAPRAHAQPGARGAARNVWGRGTAKNRASRTRHVLMLSQVRGGSAPVHQGARGAGLGSTTGRG